MPVQRDRNAGRRDQLTGRCGANVPAHVRLSPAALVVQNFVRVTVATILRGLQGNANDSADHFPVLFLAVANSSLVRSKVQVRARQRGEQHGWLMSSS